MASFGRSMAWRVLLSGLLVAYAGLAFGSGLDRMSARQPALERLVPRPFRAQADRSRAGGALLRNRADAALGAATAAVKADPVHPNSVGLLAAALSAKQDFARADDAFRVAARFGWRDLPTQLYFYAVALSAHEGKVAVDRADAILRLRPAYPEAGRLLETLEADPAGARALALRIADKPVWTGLYLNLGLAASPPVRARRAATVAAVGTGGHPLGCTVVAHFTEGLLQAGERQLAQQVWNANCPANRVTDGLTDPGFEQLDAGQVSPFGWTPRRSGDVSVRVEPGLGGKGQQVALGNRAPASRLALVQPVVLAPGRYRVSGAVRVAGATASGRLLAQAGCSDTMPFPSGVEGDLAGEGQVVTVPACDRQWFGIWVNPGAQDATLDSLSLKRIG
jgi:hypothetical protein